MMQSIYKHYFKEHHHNTSKEEQKFSDYMLWVNIVSIRWTARNQWNTKAHELLTLNGEWVYGNVFSYQRHSL